MIARATLATAALAALLVLPSCKQEEEAGVACAAPAYAQGHSRWDAAKEKRMVYIVQEPQQVEAALDTATQSLEGDEKTASAEVIVCGGAVKHLVRGSDLEPALAAATGLGVKVVACERSLKQNAVDPQSLSEHVGAVDDGLAEGVRLEKDGWLSVQM